MMDETYRTKTGRELRDEDPRRPDRGEAERGYDVERVQALNELAHRGERRARWFCGAVGLVLGLALGFALTVRDHPQMDCARDEVQVWVDFDAGTTRCVDQDDHGLHAGH